MLRSVAWSCTVALLLSVPTTAAADELRPPPWAYLDRSLPPPDSTDSGPAVSRWYGLPVAVIDGVGFSAATAGLLLASTTDSGDRRTPYVVALAGAAVYVVGPPLVHRFAYRHYWTAVGSSLLRIALPLLGALAASGNDSDLWMVGVGAGAFVASGIDVFLLARDQVPPDVAARSRAPSWTFGW
jgi:hypothetical protein